MLQSMVSRVSYYCGNLVYRLRLRLRLRLRRLKRVPELELDQLGLVQWELLERLILILVLEQPATAELEGKIARLKESQVSAATRSALRGFEMMKRFALLFLLCVLVKAQDTTTINLGLTKMGHHTHLGDWDLIYNSNFDKLDRVALPSVDARNLTGVDCAGSSDSSTALNALSANGTTFDATHTIIPKGCRLKVSASKGWTIQNHIGFGISGLSSPGGGGTPSIGTPTLSYCGDGAAGSAVLNLQRTHSPTIENLLIDGKGSGCA